jgi:DNA-binding GntR family transcriptional regulator
VLEPITRSDLVDDVCQRLRKAIFAGPLVPGQRLVEDQLAAQLGVSRAPIRDALKALEHDGLVMSAGRRGKVVTTLSAHDAWEVYSLRAALEAMGIRLAIAHGGSALLAELEAVVVEMRQAAEFGDQAEASVLDVRFHETICRASGHERLVRTWEGMSIQIRLLSQRVVGTQYADLAVVANRHAALVSVIRAGNPDAAELAVREHIDVVADRMVQSLETIESRIASGQDVQSLERAKLRASNLDGHS